MRPRAPGRVDLHCHLLPAVDDGPPTMAESVALARAVAADGTVEVAVTPHVADVEIASLAERLELLAGELAQAGVELTLLQSGELRCDRVATTADDDLDRIALGPARSRWILLEPPFQGGPADVHDAARALRGRGFGVVIAHPERAPALDGAAIELELSRGSQLLLNAGSLLGRHGSGPQRAAERLVAEGAACAVASDAHGLARPPCLTEAEATLAAAFGPAVARRLTDEAPRVLLEHGLPA
jgi:protein-tyrosine phosphatase